MRLLRRSERDEEHEAIDQRLDAHQREYEELEQRLRVLERERGIFHKPKLKEADGS